MSFEQQFLGRFLTKGAMSLACVAAVLGLALSTSACTNTSCPSGNSMRDPNGASYHNGTSVKLTAVIDRPPEDDVHPLSGKDAPSPSCP
jgi:hypothetical protein